MEEGRSCTGSFIWIRNGVGRLCPKATRVLLLLALDQALGARKHVSFSLSSWVGVISFAAGTMPEKITAEALVNNIMESLSEHAPKQILKNDTSNMVSSQFNRLFGRQNPLHKVLGGGKPADVLLWRNKKISAGVLATATSIWVLFEWLDFHFLSIVCFAIALGMVVQFVWSNASGFLNRSPSEVPRLALPDKLFVNIAVSVGAEVNKVLGFLQDVACNGNLKQFLVVVASLFAAAVFSSWCNFLTLLYIGFVGAHTLPVLYERYEDQVDSFVDNMLGQLQHHYRRFDGRVLSKIPTAKLRGKKFE
ncbi:hypothetical protein Nepgr_000725 [Nepenthes gracilis]|uniref:Reticulon-like protein n=1 Tax=Nepenthes gracilis TaxID=150966 RepID=A0AAD3P3D7_NEPGR|nr:hypothetical protein Nepgr_000725 [Nepenthes gracilis]